MEYEEAMALAILRAQLGPVSSDDVPVGAVVLDAYGNLLSISHNQREFEQDPSAHAEIIAIKLASKFLGTWRLKECTLIVTLEPCLMCAGAILQSRISRVVIGSSNVKAGACGSVWDVLRDGRNTHKVEVIYGVSKTQCAALLNNYFSMKR